MVSKRRLLSRDRVLDGKIPPLSSSSCRRVLGVTWVARVTRIRRERDSRPERRREEGGTPAGRRQRGPSEIDASLGSSLIYAFITVNNASPFTSGLSRSFSPACLPAYPTPVYLVPSFISQSYTESHSIARAKAPRSPPLPAPRHSPPPLPPVKATVSQMYFKMTRRRISLSLSPLAAFVSASRSPPLPLSVAAAAATPAKSPRGRSLPPPLSSFNKY